MSLKPKMFYTKDIDIQRIMDTLMKNRVTELSPKLAQDIGRNKTTREYRDFMIIAGDQAYHKSVIMIKEPMKIKKVGDRYEFYI
jgi:hypothetical protein